MTLWLYLHYSSLQLDSVYSQSNDKAIIVVDGKRNEVVQLNALAREQGVKVGMGLGTASALCADLGVHAYNPEVEKARLREIAHWLYLVTSDIVFFEPDGILLRVSNMLSLYGGLDNYWQQLQTHMQTMQLTTQFSTGYSPLMARLLARSGYNRITANHTALTAALKTRSLNTTELTAKSIEQLARVGVHLIEDLLNLPMADVARRFDIELVNYVGRLTGQFKHPVQFYHPPEQFQRYLELLFDIENVQWLEKPLHKLLLQMEAFLKMRDQVAFETVIRLHQRDAAPLDVTATSAAGEYMAQKWLSLFNLRLETVALDGPIFGVTLKAVRVGDREASKMDMFDGKRGNLSAKELISLLQAKLGQDAVKGITLNDDPRPRHASQYCEPLATSVAIPVNRHITRPSILLPVPRLLQEKVTIMQGPERLLTGWWDGKPVHRDYFVAHSREGQWLWVYRNHKQQWLVHGLFC